MDNCSDDTRLSPGFWPLVQAVASHLTFFMDILPNLFTSYKIFILLLHNLPSVQETTSFPSKPEVPGRKGSKLKIKGGEIDLTFFP